MCVCVCAWGGWEGGEDIKAKIAEWGLGIGMYVVSSHEAHKSGIENGNRTEGVISP